MNFKIKFIKIQEMQNIQCKNIFSIFIRGNLSHFNVIQKSFEFELLQVNNIKPFLKTKKNIISERNRFFENIVLYKERGCKILFYKNCCKSHKMAQTLLNLVIDHKKKQKIL